MSITPVFSWGFSLKPSRWLIPLFQNNMVNFGQSAMNQTGPTGWRKSSIESSSFTDGKPTVAQQLRAHHTLVTKRDTVITHQRREQHTQSIVSESVSASISPEILSTLKKPSQPEVKKQKPEYKSMSDGEILDLLDSDTIKHHNLEVLLQDTTRAVKIRRMYMAGRESESAQLQTALSDLPYEHYDYDQVFGQCCENVVGYVPIPVGVVGPVVVDGKKYLVPMATTEGCLIASTQRGAKALSYNGINSVLLNDGITRGPVLSFPGVTEAARFKAWVEDAHNYRKVEASFNSTSRFARLKEIKIGIAGRNVFLRFKCKTGDAMGMNMISKATTEALAFLQEQFSDMKVLAVSGNYCVDKKSSAINWIDGRGKSIVVDAIIPKDVVRTVLKTNVDAVVELNVAKNLVGSAMAGSIGGFNAHASNIVTAVFLACGQDAAQNVESSSCMTLMEKNQDGDLYISCTMPSIEVGTVGGGSTLKAQAACLNMLGVKGSNPEEPGKNAQTLARIVASTVMAGELSLMSALASGDLVRAHMIHNRGSGAQKLQAKK